MTESIKLDLCERFEEHECPEHICFCNEKIEAVEAVAEWLVRGGHGALAFAITRRENQS